VDMNVLTTNYLDEEFTFLDCPGSIEFLGDALNLLPGIDAAVVVTGSDGSRTGDRYRLITTLLDHRRFPAHRLARLYHERWVRHEVAWSEWNSQKEGRLMSVT